MNIDLNDPVAQQYLRALEQAAHRFKPEVRKSRPWLRHCTNEEAIFRLGLYLASYVIHYEVRSSERDELQSRFVDNLERIRACAGELENAIKETYLTLDHGNLFDAELEHHWPPKTPKLISWKGNMEFIRGPSEAFHKTEDSPIFQLCGTLSAVREAADSLHRNPPQKLPKHAPPNPRVKPAKVNLVKALMSVIDEERPHRTHKDKVADVRALCSIVNTELSPGTIDRYLRIPSSAR